MPPGPGRTYLRDPGKVLRSQSPDLVKQEIWGYLLTHYAISDLICTAATAARISTLLNPVLARTTIDTAALPKTS